MERAKPKSHTYIVQSSFTKIFPGFKSLWIIFAACRYLSAHKISYTIDLTWVSSRCLLDLSNFFKSMSHRLKTKYTSLKSISSRGVSSLISMRSSSFEGIYSLFGGRIHRSLLQHGCVILFKILISRRSLLARWVSTKTCSKRLQAYSRWVVVCTIYITFP